MPTIRDTSVNKLDLITTPIVDVDITAVSNNVEIENKASSAVITDIKKGTSVNVGVPVKQNIIITGQSIQGSTGPAGPQGPPGPSSPTGSFITSASISNATITFTKGDSSIFLITVNNVQNAVTASYALNAAAGESFRIITGSVIAQVNTTNNLFLIKSASTNFVTVNSTGAMTLKNNSSIPFLITNLSTQPIFTVSSSGVVIIATSSIELSNPAPNGGIYFTSSSFFVGLD